MVIFLYSYIVCTVEVRTSNPNFKLLKNILKLSKVVRDVFSKNFAP